MTWARLSGLDVPELRQSEVGAFVSLPEGLPTGGGTVLLVRRFDRGEPPVFARTHFEDFGQILDRPPGDRQYSGAYEEIAGVLRYICPDQWPGFIQRLVFMVLSGNGDAHLKNWAVSYADRRTPILSPLYDQVATLLYIKDEQLALSLFGARNFSEVRWDHIVKFATIFGVSQGDVGRIAADAVCRSLDAFEKVAGLWTDNERAVLQRHMASLPLVTQRPAVVG